MDLIKALAPFLLILIIFVFFLIFWLIEKTIKIKNEFKLRIKNRIQEERINEEKEKINNFIQKHSIALRRLRSINQKKFFYSFNKREYEHKYDNQTMYNEISCEDYLIYQLQCDKTKVLEEMKKVQFNNEHFETYIEDVNKIKLFGEYDMQPEKLNYNDVIELEKKIFEKEILDPMLVYTINVQIHYVKMNGTLVETKNNFFDEKKIKYLIKELSNRNGIFYINKNIWDSIVRVERGKVTNEMRFFIFERDNYRCKCCGRSEDQVNLEVDHILPISKGGKSNNSNLQTLCEECNRIKGTKHQRY